MILKILLFAAVILAIMSVSAIITLAFYNTARGLYLAEVEDSDKRQTEMMKVWEDALAGISSAEALMRASEEWDSTEAHAERQKLMALYMSQDGEVSIPALWLEQQAKKELDRHIKMLDRP